MKNRMDAYSNALFLVFLSEFSPSCPRSCEMQMSAAWLGAFSSLHRRCAPYTRPGRYSQKGFAISDQACRRDIAVRVDLPRPQFHDSRGFSFHLQGLGNRSYSQRYGCEREWNCDFRMPRHKTRSELFPPRGRAARAGRKSVGENMDTIARSSDDSRAWYYRSSPDMYSSSSMEFELNSADELATRGLRIDALLVT